MAETVRMTSPSSFAIRRRGDTADQGPRALQAEELDTHATPVFLAPSSANCFASCAARRARLAVTPDTRQAGLRDGPDESQTRRLSSHDLALKGVTFRMINKGKARIGCHCSTLAKNNSARRSDMRGASVQVDFESRLPRRRASPGYLILLTCQLVVQVGTGTCWKKFCCSDRVQRNFFQTVS